MHCSAATPRRDPLLFPPLLFSSSLSSSVTASVAHSPHLSSRFSVAAAAPRRTSHFASRRVSSRRSRSLCHSLRTRCVPHARHRSNMSPSVSFLFFSFLSFPFRYVSFLFSGHVSPPPLHRTKCRQQATAQVDRRQRAVASLSSPPMHFNASRVEPHAPSRPAPSRPPG